MDSTDTAPDRLFGERYRAISSRDRRFDGQFVTAVQTTGVYCRPSCPASTPRPENVIFFRTSAAAHTAGYRACKRCLPEATPGTPEWDGRRDLAGRAMRLVRDGVVDREGVAGLAARLGYTPRHLHRVLVAELGAGPLALARAQRAQTARALVTETNLSLADVAFAAGFGSIRQFNDTMTDIFAVTPTQLRARSARPESNSSLGADPVAPTRLRLTLPVREPYDARGIVEFLACRAVAGVERADIDALTYARTVLLPHGPGAFEVHSSGGRFAVDLELASLADLPVVIARIRHLLDLDADPDAVDGALAVDPTIAPLVRATPGIRLPGAIAGDEIVARALVGQQISVAAARTHLGRLAATAGTAIDSGLGLTRLFPTAAQLAAAPDVLTGPARRVAAFRAVIETLAAGDVVVSRAADPAELRSALLALPGVGPWTAGYVAMRVLHDPDVLLSTDGALLAGARALGLDGSASAVAGRARAIGRYGERWAPWRSYASMHLWRAVIPRPAPPRPIDAPARHPATPLGKESP